MSFRKKITKITSLVLVGIIASLPITSNVHALQKNDKIDFEQNLEEDISTEIKSIIKKSIDINEEIEKKVLAEGYKSVEEYNEQIGDTIPLEKSIYYNNFEYYAIPLPETIENSNERAIQLWVWAKAAWSLPWVRSTVTNFGKAVLAGSSAQIGANIVNDTREVMKNGLPKISTHSSSSVVGYGNITRGDKVKLAQTLLKQHGYDVAIDGIWGPKSESATKNFQRKLNMTADGLIGKHTWAYLIEHLK